MKTKNKYYEIAEFKSLDIFIEAVAFIASILLFMLKDGHWNYFLLSPAIQILSAIYCFFHSLKNEVQLKIATVLRIGLICYYAFVGLIVFVIAFYPAIILLCPPLFLGLLVMASIGCVLFFGGYFNLMINEMNFYATLSKKTENIDPL